MATKKKMLQAAAGNAGGGAGLDITDVFSTYLYEGNGSTQTITNGIDLSGEGGLVWQKGRSLAYDHQLTDTERGVNKTLSTVNTASEATRQSVSQFNTDGFLVGTEGDTNANNQTYASWTFRKAPKFFDVVTYTGDGVAGREIAHNLGSVPGMIVVKCLNNVTNWAVYHRGVDSTSPEDYVLRLNDTTARANAEVNWNDTAPTSTHFTVGTNSWVNRSGDTYVAYLFAHNDGDGEFGPDGDQDIIKCGSYTGNGSYLGGPEIDLGFEPQWVMLKNAESTGDWLMFDNMRGIDDSTSTKFLEANTSSAENTTQGIKLTSTGFQVTGNNIDENSSGVAYIYIAIRRGPLAPPESATEVFAMEDGRDTGTPSYTSNFPVDFTMIQSKLGSNWNQISRLQGGQRYLYSNNTSSEANDSDVNQHAMDLMDGIGRDKSAYSPNFAWMWKRAPNFFDVVAYTGNATAGRTVSHNLGVAPEMIWIKARDLSSDDWAVYSAELGNTKHMRINGSDDAFTSTNIWNATSPSITEFTLGTLSEVNRNGNDYIAYLFASLDGVSRCGSYTGNGSSQTINCGFTSGARFILIKRTDSTGDWYVWDSVRGIVAGNDPYLELNTTDAEVTSTDWVDPDNSGFIVNGTTINASSAEYIFYSVA